jgi:hypothetical protein
MHGPVPETASPADGTRAATRAAAARRRPYRHRLTGAAAFALLLAVLFAAFLRLSATYPENSDEANILLMASDLAHGNLFLSGWNVSDVPFITTELPEIALLVRVFGLHLSTAHVAAALTYTVVVAVGLLLSGGTTFRTGGSPPPVSPRPRTPRGGPDGQKRHRIGRAGLPGGTPPASSDETGPVRYPVVRMAVALVIMLVPQPGVGVFVLLFSVGHIGTAAPVMLTWLFLDRAWTERPLRRAWPVPLVTGLLLAWALMADPLVLLIGVLPVPLVAVVRLARDFTRSRSNGRVLRHCADHLTRHALDLAMMAAAGVAWLVAWAGQRLLHAAGGYRQQPVPFTLDPAGTWYAHARVMLHGLLEMFGAFFLPGNAVNHLGPGNDVAAPPLSALAVTVAVARLACVALAAWGAWAAARRFFRPDADLVSQLLLVGIVANLAAYLPSSLAGHTALNAREFAPVLPFAAVLAGRTLGTRIGARLHGRTRPDRAVAAALAALLGLSAVGLVAETRIPVAANPLARLESYLVAHHLRAGIGGYWDASVITVDTGGAVTVRAVTAGCLQPYAWESKPAWYDPAGQAATFLLTSAAPGYFSRWKPGPAAQRRLDAIARPSVPAVLRPGPGYAVRVYQGNLLASLPALGPC